MPYLKRDTWYLSFIDSDGQKRRVASSARMKAEARHLEEELSLKHHRIREQRALGLEPSVVDSGDTLGELLEWWLEQRDTSTTSDE